MSSQDQLESNDQENIKLKIDSHVVRQLGEELISDPEQAVLELVKNSYDADSPWCTIEIDTICDISKSEVLRITSIQNTNKEEVEKLSKEKTTLKGRIVIKDNGSGMSLDQIINGWLTISHSEKRHLKKERNVTEKFGRAYQGDKGLGRLSSMKLGQVLKITTSNEGGQGISIGIDWTYFIEGTTLDIIPLYKEELQNVSKGTTIEVIGLNNIQYWEGERAGKSIQTRLSTLFDPFGIEESFLVTLKIDSQSFPLTSFDENFLKPTVAQFSYTFENKNLICSGVVKLPYYIPAENINKSDIKAETIFKRYLAADNGDALLQEFHAKRGKLKSYNIKRSEKEGWFIEFSQTIPWVEMTKDDIKSFSLPGNFTAEWNYFYKKGSTFNLLTEKNFSNSDLENLNELVGVGVYKNGFRVGTSKNDWLGFSIDKTSGMGFYSLRPENVFGFIQFSGYEGESLKEKSDRQGFVENSTYKGFRVVTHEMIAFANTFLNTTRRISNDFINKCKDNENNKPSNYDAESAATELDELVESTKSGAKETRKSELKTEQALIQATEKIDNTLSDVLLDDKSRKEIIELKKQVEQVQNTFNDFKDKHKYLESNIIAHSRTAEKIIEELNRSKSKLQEFYASAAVGLSAENLVHDINPLLDEITLNTSNIKTKLSNQKFNDKSVFLSLNQISATSKVIAKDISLINPMLRSRRSTVSTFSVEQAMRDYIALRTEKLERKNILFNLKVEQGIYINFVRGRFTQVLDNLFRNSEYWLEHLGKHTEISKQINITLNEHGFFFWDTGPGIFEKMEDVLFEMFETAKNNGQGLGLFIVSTILNESNCKITLLDERNDFARKFKFYIDLKSVISNI